MEEELAALVESAGIGQVPILDVANRRLHDELISIQLEAAEIECDLEKENDSFSRMHSHSEAVEAATSDAQRLAEARKSQIDAERDMLAIHHMETKRNKKEIGSAEEGCGTLGEDVEDLAEDVEAVEAVLGLLDSEHKSDLAALQDRSDGLRELEKDILEMLKCRHEDEARIGKIQLRLEKARDKMAKNKAELDSSSTDNMTAQLALDKTAEEFRRLHDERDFVLAKWEETLGTMRRRDDDLSSVFADVNTVRDKNRKRDLELKEQHRFLGNEKENVKEVEREIADGERKLLMLTKESESLQGELNALEGALLLEERETAKLASDAAAKRARIKDVKDAKARLEARAKALGKILEEGRERRAELEGEAASADTALKDLSAVLNGEEKRRDALRFELDRLREAKFKREAALKKTEAEEAATEVTSKGLRMEREGLRTRIEAAKADLAKKEELSMANDYRIVQLEREIAELKGVSAPENRAEAKAELEALKEELKARNSEKRNLDHMVHKILAESTRLSRELDKLSKEHEAVLAKLEETGLVVEKSKKQEAVWKDRVEALLLEEKLLMVNERKVREDLESVGRAIMDLSKQAMASDEDIRKQRLELESQRDQLLAQQKHLKGDMRSIRIEIRERKDQIDRVKIRYDHVVKSLGEVRTFDEESKVPSHAYHVVQMAQEKAELKERAVVLQRKLNKEEKELAGLEKAMSMLKNSNSKYRADKFGAVGTAMPGEGDTQEIRQLKQKLKEKTVAADKLRTQMASVESDCRTLESQLARASADLGQSQAQYEDRSAALEHLKKENKDHDLKLSRARNVCATLSDAMKSTLAGPAIYEQDMDLRAEKEKQRSALLKLRELSMADPVFECACRAEVVERMALPVPTLSRIELMTTASARGATPRSRSVGRLATAESSASSSGTGSASMATRMASFYKQRATSSSSLLVMEVPTQSTTSATIQMPAVR